MEVLFTLEILEVATLIEKYLSSEENENNKGRITLGPILRGIKLDTKNV